jgi:aminopeptidase N
MVLAPSDWSVITNTAEISAISSKNTADFNLALNRFKVNPKSEILSAFGDTEVVAHEFTRSVPISTYLFCIVAGAFDGLEPSPGKAHPKIPMKLYCRKSLTQYVESMKDDWFRITQNGIAFYEKVFNTPYPFDKFDQVFCPDYSMGAMENVGCVTYNDEYVPRGEAFTRDKWENTFNTILHEISHMWFGNLVTMKWWDDLWLNESFANMISYMCMDEGEGLEDITLAWNIFLMEQSWGLTTDQKETSHPIAASCETTGDAQDIFDGISYGKGASWLHQMVFFFGKDFLKEGLKTYFAKYSFKNTELSDFISEMQAAQIRLGIEKEIDFTAWSDTWLKTAGPALIESQIEYGADNKITKFNILQTPYNIENIPQNQLRVQRFNIATLDANMKITHEVTV